MKILLKPALTLFLALGVNACNQPAATISGIVCDRAHKQPVTGATVWISGQQKRVQTDTRGHYALEYVPGSFTFEVSAKGYRPGVSRPLQYTQAAAVELAPFYLDAYPDPAEWAMRLKNSSLQNDAAPNCQCPEYFLPKEIVIESVEVGEFTAVPDGAMIKDLGLKYLGQSYQARGEAQAPVTIHYLAKAATGGPGFGKGGEPWETLWSETRHRAAGERWQQQFVLIITPTHGEWEYGNLARELIK